MSEIVGRAGFASAAGGTATHINNLRQDRCTKPVRCAAEAMEL
jgi:hypothetical protein